MISLIEEQIELRGQLKAKIMDIVFSRCVSGPRYHIQRGSLYYYIWRKLGFQGNTGRVFSAFCKHVLEENGFPCSAIRGNKCIKGLAWSGENPKNWRHPIGADIPIHNTPQTYKLPGEL